jgi:bifunctional DNase/RNase
MVEVFVSRLGLDSSSNSYVVVLQEKGGDRVLPIWIGRPEAESIVTHMHNVKHSRPLTHDLVRSIVVGLGAELRRASITRVADRTYFAELELRVGDSVVTIDARPSDSIAIALRLSAAIFAAEDLLVDPLDEIEEAEDEGPDYGSSFDVESAQSTPDAELTAEQLKRYLEALRPEDFGKFKP